MKPKPFHESIIDAIDNCTGPGEDARETLKVLGKLIISTKIPKNHQSIKQAFDKAVDYWGDGLFDGLLSSVSEKLDAEQAKQSVEQK